MNRFTHEHLEVLKRSVEVLSRTIHDYYGDSIKGLTASASINPNNPTNISMVFNVPKYGDYTNIETKFDFNLCYANNPLTTLDIQLTYDDENNIPSRINSEFYLDGSLNHFEEFIDKLNRLANEYYIHDPEDFNQLLNKLNNKISEDYTKLFKNAFHRMLDNYFADNWKVSYPYPKIEIYQLNKELCSDVFSNAAMILDTKDNDNYKNIEKLMDIISDLDHAPFTGKLNKYLINKPDVKPIYDNVMHDLLNLFNEYKNNTTLVYLFKRRNTSSVYQYPHIKITPLVDYEPIIPYVDDFNIVNLMMLDDNIVIKVDYCDGDRVFKTEYYKPNHPVFEYVELLKQLSR